MEFRRRNINKTQRNGEIIAVNVSSTSFKSSNGGGGFSSSNGGDYLPAIKNSDGTYTVNLSEVTFIGNVIAQGEVAAHQSGTSEASSGTAITVYDGLDSNSAYIALSANQGRVLKNLIETMGNGTSINIIIDEDSLADNQILVYNATTKQWENKANEGISEISKLKDVSLSNIADKQILVYNGTTSKWENKTVDTVTAEEKTSWNNKLDKSVWDSAFYFDDKGNIRVKLNLIGDEEISAYGSGTSTSTGAITIVDNLNSSLTDAALSANQGRVLKTLIDNIDMGDFDLSDYSLTSHTHNNYSLTSHTHNNYSTTGHTHTIANITNLQSSLDAKSGTGHSHSNYATTTALNTHTADTTVHVTATERTNWNNVYNDWNDVFEIDSKGQLKVKVNVIGQGEISAYGSGNSTSTGAITIVDNLNSTLTDAALSANQGRVLKTLIDNIDMGDFDLSDYSKTSHTHSNYSTTSHTHSDYSTTEHTHTIANITNLQSSLDAKSGTGHTHSYASTVKVGTTSYNVNSNIISIPAYPTLSTLGGASSTDLGNHTANTTAHITAAERTNWNAAYNNNHTHSNKSVLDGITSTKVSNWDKVYKDWNDVFTIDSNGNLKVKVNLIGEKEVSAYGSGSSTSTGAITIVDNLTSTLTDAALSANQGRVLKSLIDSANMGDFDLSDYSKTSHTHSNYSTTSHTHSNYSTTGHTHSIANITNLQTTLDGKSGTGHTHSAYSPTSHTHSNYSVTSHTHSAYATTGTVNTHTADTTVHITAAERTAWNAKSDAHSHPYASSSHTHSISNITNLQSTLDGKSGTGHSHSNYSVTSHTHSAYYDSAISRTANTVLAAPNGSNGSATFRSLVAADIPTLAISKISNLQSSLDGKSGTGHSHSNYSITSHTHNYAGSSSAGGAATSANKVNSTLTFTGGTFAAKTFNGSAAVTVNVPTHTSHITNNSGFITTAATVANANYATSAGSATNATTASKLSTVSKTAWGQTFWTSGGIPASISGNMTGVGSISATGNITTSAEVTAHSDKRLKDNIQPLTNRGYITPTTYIKDGKKSIGFVAQEMQKLYPELVTVDESTEEKYLTVNYMQYTAVLQAQIIELSKEIQELKDKLNDIYK